MKTTKEQKKLELHTETLRNLQPSELKQAAGGARFLTETELAGGCTVTNGEECVCKVP